MEVTTDLQDKNEERWLRLQYKVFEGKIAKCFRLFREEGIEPILIKGWSVSLYYPESWKRITTDIDLCVKPELYEKALEISRTRKGSSLSIDLHRGFRHLDTLDWDELFANSQIRELEGESVRILSPEDNLRIVCVHWLNDGGRFKDKLWDIYYLVKNRPKDFDWKKCLDKVSNTRRIWIICGIGLAHKYLGLDLSDIPFEKESKNLPVWLIDAVEKEWQSDVELKSLLSVRNDRKQLLEQIRKRLPPNPIQATIELEGKFDESPRAYYQILNIFQRSYISVKKIFISKYK